jgi:hypothetical protein
MDCDNIFIRIVQLHARKNGTKQYVQKFGQPLLHNTCSGVAKRQRDKETILIGFQ